MNFLERIKIGVLAGALLINFSWLNQPVEAKDCVKLKTVLSTDIPYPPPDDPSNPDSGDSGGSGGGNDDSGSDGGNPNPDNPYDPDNQPMPN